MPAIKVGVIPAAGEGKRMGYLGYIIPKCLFPLFDKPIIHYIVENMKKTGIERILIPVWYQKRKIIQYFDSIRDEVDVEIDVISLERLPPGIASTIASTERYVDGPFMTILGDDVTITNSLANLVTAFVEKNATVIEGITMENDRRKLLTTCCLKVGEENQILGIAEKPKHPFSNLRGCGIYVFSDEIFEYIKKTPVSSTRNEVEITDTIGLVAKEGRAYVEPIQGTNLNINTYEDLFNAWLLVKSKNE